MAWVIQTSTGEVRLFASQAASLRWEARAKSRFIVGGCEVNGAHHWRGAIPANGVRFTREDQSTPQLVAALANEW